MYYPRSRQLFAEAQAVLMPVAVCEERRLVVQNECGFYTEEHNATSQVSGIGLWSLCLA